MIFFSNIFSIITNSYLLYIALFIFTFTFLIIKKYRMHPKVVEKINFGTIEKHKKTDLKCYGVLYNVYIVIGTEINMDNIELSSDTYLIKYNQAKRLFYGVKRTKDLIKSNYMLDKIKNKMSLYNVEKNEIDETIIYLIMVVLCKK